MIGLVLFFVLIGVISMGMVVSGRWWTVLGAILFVLDAWFFWTVMELLKR